MASFQSEWCVASAWSHSFQCIPQKTTGKLLKSIENAKEFLKALRIVKFRIKVKNDLKLYCLVSF